MFNKLIIACALFASLACTTFTSAQSIREKAIKAAYQGPQTTLNIKSKRFNIKKANVRLGPGTRIVDGRISYFSTKFPPVSKKISYTMVFRRDGTLVDINMKGVKSAGVYDAVQKRTAVAGLKDGSWQGSVRYLVAEIGLAVPRDWVGTPMPPTIPAPEDEGTYEDEGSGGGGGGQSPQSYFLGVSTSLVQVTSGQGQHYNRRQQRFSGDSYGLRINSVVPGSPAQRAGLEPGDIVISADQKSMTQQNSLSMAVAQSNGQLDMIVQNVRNGRSVGVVVELDAQTSTFGRRRSGRRR